MKNLFNFATIFTFFVVISSSNRINTKETKESQLQKCLNTTQMTDIECDSCYHAIYGQEDKNCGLCE